MSASALHFHTDRLHHPQVVEMLTQHLADMYRVSPPESVHALDLSALDQPSILFWSAWTVDAQGQEHLVGTCALKALDSSHAELKSMHIAPAQHGNGSAQRLWEHVHAQARARHVQRISLETGTQDFFAPARSFYARNGFAPCGPFSGYRLDPHSCFMTRVL